MMPPVPSEQRAGLLKQLSDDLNRLTVPELRSIAYTWGWLLRGNLKSSLVEQVTGYLSDTEQMVAAFRALSEIQREALGWLSGSLGKGEIATALQTALHIGSKHNPSKEEVGEIMAGLKSRGLLIFDAYRGYYVPGLYGEWLPGVLAAGLTYEGRAVPEPPMGAGRLNEYAEHLLTSIESDKPQPAPKAVPGKPAPALGAAARTSPPALLMSSRGGLVSEETLRRWNYVAQEDLALARVLLDLMFGGGLLAVKDHLLGGRRLEPDAKALSVWRTQSPEVHQRVLRNWWLGNWQRIGPQSPLLEWSWNELDIALSGVRTYHFHQTVGWATPDQLEREVGFLRSWLASLLQRLRTDTWFSFRRFCELIYNLQRDLLHWYQYYPTWQWYRDQTPLDASKMDFATWLATYGMIVAAWMDGPARWLGLVQVALEDGQPVAFQRPSEIIERGETRLPADTLRFSGEDAMVLRNLWQAGELRELVKLIAAETERGRDTTTYRLDTVAFRDALRSGRSAAQITQAFAGAGFPLPQAMANRLGEWQARAGRHQIYDNLAVIEFGNDEILQEVQTAVNLERLQVYPVSPRCLVILDPSAVQPLVDELRRKGYTPQVIAS